MNLPIFFTSRPGDVFNGKRAPTRDQLDLAAKVQEVPVFVDRVEPTEKLVWLPGFGLVIVNYY